MITLTGLTPPPVRATINPTSQGVGEGVAREEVRRRSPKVLPKTAIIVGNPIVSH